MLAQLFGSSTTFVWKCTPHWDLSLTAVWKPFSVSKTNNAEAIVQYQGVELSSRVICDRYAWFLWTGASKWYKKQLRNSFTIINSSCATVTQITITQCTTITQPTTHAHQYNANINNYLPTQFNELFGVKLAKKLWVHFPSFHHKLWLCVPVNIK